MARITKQEEQAARVDVLVFLGGDGGVGGWGCGCGCGVGEGGGVMIDVRR